MHVRPGPTGNVYEIACHCIVHVCKTSEIKETQVNVKLVATAVNLMTDGQTLTRRLKISALPVLAHCNEISLGQTLPVLACVYGPTATVAVIWVTCANTWRRLSATPVNLKSTSSVLSEGSHRA